MKTIDHIFGTMTRFGMVVVICWMWFCFLGAMLIPVYIAFTFPDLNWFLRLYGFSMSCVMIGATYQFFSEI